ncbi:hypothetical protein I305_03562 [Cryptococcus gattii E566]|nr:hypothetical protein I305_03562 [Cryptococcus gattii E566]
MSSQAQSQFPVFKPRDISQRGFNLRSAMGLAGPEHSSLWQSIHELVCESVLQAGFTCGKTWKESTFMQCDLFTRLMQDQHPDLFSWEKYHNLWPLEYLGKQWLKNKKWYMSTNSG